MGLGELLLILVFALGKGVLRIHSKKGCMCPGDPVLTTTEEAIRGRGSLVEHFPFQARSPGFSSQHS